MEVLATAAHHRTRERVRDLGEVFTPNAYIEDMLNLLGSKNSRIWSDESVAFFEPCCGHGNFVVAILKRRIHALYKRASTQKIKSPEMWAIANALNTLWAIDIDYSNIAEARQRIFSEVISFMIQMSRKTAWNLLIKNQDFFAHVICAIEWHISENETLSALSSAGEAGINARQTKAGDKWFKSYGHKRLNFDLPWTTYYLQSKSSKADPIRFKKAIQLIKGVLDGRSSAAEEFAFTKDYFDKLLNQISVYRHKQTAKARA